MYRNKKDVDKHVENLLSKLSAKEFKTRAYSVARLYFEVGDYSNCQIYVEQYLTQKDNNAAAYKLLGQALQKLGQKEKALEQYKTSLDIDPAQTSTILDICELLADDEVTIELGRARYWCEKAEATFPRHPVTFRLRERLMGLSNPDPEALVKLIIAELAIRPKDASLHARLLKHYLHINKVKEAFNHGCNVEFTDKTFTNNYAWYEVLNELLKHNSHNTKDWLFQLLLLTVKERICLLSIAETTSGSSKSLIETSELLHAYDQAIEVVDRAGAWPGFGEFHASLVQHHRGQFAFHAATLLLKKAKKDQVNWHDATKFAAPLMLIAWQVVPLDSKVNWLKNAPEKHVTAVKRWYSEGTYRCSQAGHYLLANIQDKNQTFLDQVSQCYAGTHWRDKLYKKIFTSKSHLDKIKTSHFTSIAFHAPVLRLPRKVEVEAYDSDAQREYGNSLHHFVWILLNYKNYAHFKCTLFDMLTQTATTCGPETLNKLDIDAFLYCAALTVRQQLPSATYLTSEKPIVLPANITDLLCPLAQMKWWDCAYKFSQNQLGSELTDIRATLSRGIEVVRCIDKHGLDPELLCSLGRIFGEKSKLTTIVDEKTQHEIRAALYYSSAIPLLEKLKSRITVKILEKRLFDYTHKELNTKELNALLEESKLYVAGNHLNDGEYEKVIEILSNLKSPQAYYHLSQAYKKIAIDENNLSSDIESKSKFGTMLYKARNFGYKALDIMRDSDVNTNSGLYSDTQHLIEDIETCINKIDPDLSIFINDDDASAASDNLPIRTNPHMFRNISSTPKAPSNINNTNYRTATDTQILENTRVDQRYLETIEHEIKILQKRDTTINDFMEQTKNWFDENRKLGNQIISTIHSNMQNTTDQFKLLKISVDQVKDQIDECRNECKDVGEMKKQIAELKIEVTKLKKGPSEQTTDNSDLYNMEDAYRSSDNSSTFPNQLPFAPTQVMPPFNQRLVPPFPVPPNPYQLYNQNLYNLYSQYSQFAQPSSVPAAQPIFDPTRAHMNYPGVYPTPDQMYLDVAHLVPPTVVPTASTCPPVPVPTLPTVQTMPAVPTLTVPPPIKPVTTSKMTSAMDTKQVPRSLPVNVVITSSDPLPTCTTAPAPILSVTIPSKHIKGTPHNYQITMPSTNETNMSPHVYAAPTQTNKMSNTTSSPLSNWNQASVFRNTMPVSSTIDSFSGSSIFMPNTIGDTFDTSKTVVDGMFASSPNTSLNKSRTLSERSNTSVDNYDPCPDFKPIVPLPAEVKVTTGEEDETAIFRSRAKLFRFVDKQWKERGLGEMKLLKHEKTGKVRVLMRREQIHKICANHIITAEMEIKPMKNETKAYFWVANDYADETVVLEKFCIRFKTADIALEFYNAFEQARLECSADVTVQGTSNTGKISISEAPKLFSGQLSVPVKDNAEKPIATNTGKAVVGGFTFSSMPTFKSVSDNLKSDIKPQEPAAKVNVFSGLSFTANSNSPFSNVFNTTAPSNSAATFGTTQTQESPAKVNTSDTVEEFEPNVEFKPVVPLPALVEQKTGEEDETILFEQRAKLLRFEAATKEWKERGLGIIKLLVNKNNGQKVRLLMRREQIMKVCCNHAVTNEMVFQKMPNLDKAVTWCAKDFSEGELVAETFCLRFKTVQGCDDFIQAITSAQSKMKDESKTEKEEQNTAKQNNQTGFGNKFKPKTGSWQCDSCYTNNLESFSKCACCEQPNPNNSAKVITSRVSDTNSNNTISSGWGDKFKPKPGSWECTACFIRNEANAEDCKACNSPRDPTKAKTTVNLASDNAPKFNFGIPKAITITEIKNVAERQQTNEPKPMFGTIPSGAQFRFGIPPNGASNEKPKTETSSIFDGTGAHKFNFGIPLNNSITVTVISSCSEDQKPISSSIFGTPKLAGDNQAVDFSLNKPDEPCTPDKPTSLTSIQTEGASSFVFKESGTFDFVFKPKTPVKGKSPVKSPKSDAGDESDDNSYSPEDCAYIPFSPVVPMPDKVEVITGEENETELYGHTAKLYRYASGEWKERGKGIVKILKHKDTGKLRVVMRRDQVLKICLNHVLCPEITYTPKDEKTWFFAANDFSEGELSLQQFCLRFKSKEIALEFKDSVDKAKEGKLDGALKKDDITNKSEKEGDVKDDDVLFVSEIQATTEEKQKAKELMLPENFFTYKNKEPCQGCRGCSDDEKNSASSTAISKHKFTADTIISTSTTESKPSTTSAMAPLRVPFSAITSVGTPAKTSTPSFQSPTTSIYGTPNNMEKTVDTSIFRTPLGDFGSNTKTITPSSTDDESISDAIDKENLVQKPHTVPKMVFGELTKPATLFGGGDSQTPVGTKTGLLAPPKLSSLNMSTEKITTQEPAPMSIFGAANKSLFGEVKPGFGNANLGTSINRSIFQFTEKTADTAVSGGAGAVAPEVKSIFGDDNKSENLFTGATQGSIFGPGALSGVQSKPTTGSIFVSSGISAFGAISSQNQLFGNGKSIFGSNQTSIFGNNEKTENKTTDMTASNDNTDNRPEHVNTEKDSVKKEGPFSADNSLSFAALSTGTDGGFGIQIKPDFKWEGAGQQLFVAAQKTPVKESGDKSNIESGAGDEAGGAGADEEYDPHYEPIVPLPDKIVVTTGEEDEVKMFGERCKLYRYDERTREWKERGVGEMKVLYHSGRNTYRLLLRREQVHKAVLNMLLHMDLEFLQMKNSDRAWTWAGRNFAENPAGEQETLAVRFKSVDLANLFQEKVTECVRKLQAAAAKAERDEQEYSETFANVAPLRLPKHLEDSARADSTISAEVKQRAHFAGASTTRDTEPNTETSNGEVNQTSGLTDVFKQVHFQEYQEEEHEDEEEDYDHDYDAYYNEEEEESATYYACDGEAVIRQGTSETTCSNAHIQVLFDQDVYSPKIMVTDSATGEILADMLIHTETEFQMNGDTCVWSGTDYTSNDPVDKTVTVNFYDSDTAMQFYDSCETSKAATYSSTDPES